MPRQRGPYSGVLFVIYGNMVLYGFVQTMRGVIYPLMKNNFAVSYSRQGFMVFLVSCTSVAACAAAGIFLNRFGFRKSIAAGFAAVLAGMASFLAAPQSGAAAGFPVIAGMFILIQAGLGFFEIGLNGMGAKTFTKKSALMMNLLHFFYGMGAILGPAFAGFVANGLGLNWRLVYPIGLIPTAAMALVTFFVMPKDPPPAGADPGPVPADTAGKSGAGRTAANGFTFWSALREPMVWRFGIILGLASAGEVSTANWSGLYLQDVYGYDPKTTGAAFLSLFYIFYTTVRLFGGFIIEKTGYFKSLLFAAGAIVILFAAGFSLGRNGIWILPFTGLFLAIIYPTVLAVNIRILGERAQTAGSAILVIAFSLGGIIQFLIGLTNRYLGEAWGYRSCIVYTTVMGILLWRLSRIIFLCK
ncbi:MAG: MFS transporter [Treponema sp.]|jgi:fucose permease|nr:MFS transporter [Treponema sp.]